MGQEPDWIDRVSLLVKGAAPSRAEIEDTVTLARALGAELRALMVHDEALLSLADLGIVSEITTMGRRRALSRPHLRRSLRVIGTSVETMLEQATREASLCWSFEQEGRTLLEIFETMTSGEILVLGGRSHCPPLTQSARERAGQTANVLCFFDSRPSSVRALQLAAGIADRDHKNLIVCLIPDDRDDRGTREKRVRTLIAETGPKLLIRSMASLTVASVDQIAREDAADRLVLAKDGDLEEAVAFSNGAHCTLIFVS
jgi:hypothetical protein